MWYSNISIFAVKKEKIARNVSCKSHTHIHTRYQGAKGDLPDTVSVEFHAFESHFG